MTNSKPVVQGNGLGGCTTQMNNLSTPEASERPSISFLHLDFWHHFGNQCELYLVRGFQGDCQSIAADGSSYPNDPKYPSIIWMLTLSLHKEFLEWRIFSTTTFHIEVVVLGLGMVRIHVAVESDIKFNLFDVLGV